MHEVKVGQVWKWYHDDSDEFTVLAVRTDSADIQYLGNGGFRSTCPLSYWDDDSILLSDVEGLPAGDVQEENNQLSPNVYQFPNGVEVKDISAHLTSFGGQALQYIARATRLDGVVKGLPVQDLYKAIELLKWEAERMEALQK